MFQVGDVVKYADPEKAYLGEAVVTAVNAVATTIEGSDWQRTLYNNAEYHLRLVRSVRDVAIEQAARELLAMFTPVQDGRNDEIMAFEGYPTGVAVIDKVQEKIDALRKVLE